MDYLALRILDSLPESDKQHVHILADRLKEVYVRIMRKEVKKYRLSASYDILWVTLAIKVHALKGNATDYMKFQFQYGPPFANVYEVCSNRSVEQYRLEIQTDAPVRRADDVLLRQLKTVAMFMDRGRTLREILLDTFVELNSLVFYCLAVAGGHLDLAAQESVQAAQFLKKYPEYRASTILGDLFVEPPAIQRTEY